MARVTAVDGVPALTAAAVQYGWRELARRAGVSDGNGTGTGFESLGIAVRYGSLPETPPERPMVVVIPSEPEDWRRLVEAAPGALDWVPGEEAVPAGASPPLPGPLPVLFRGHGPRVGRGFARRVGNMIVFDCDILSSTLFLLTRWEETAIPDRDEHGRMPAQKSAAFRQGFLDRPIVDEYALILREWLRALLPGWSPRRSAFSVKLSHDVDAVRPVGTLSGAVRTVGGDLVRRHSLSLAMKTARLAAFQTLWPRQTALYRGIFRLADISRRFGMDSAFYFMAAKRTPYDSGYDPGWPPVREAILKLRSQGFEIGFHPSYRTVDEPERLAEEKARLDVVLGDSRYGGWQHFLRFKAPDTWRQWERLGLVYDSTLSFADHEGFRCGTCHPYHPFDLEKDRELGLLEIPLIVMDGTLRQYRDLSPWEAEDRVLALARRCQAVGGVFTLLWHNSSLDGEWAAWAPSYERMVEALTALVDNSANVSEPRGFESATGGVESGPVS